MNELKINRENMPGFKKLEKVKNLQDILTAILVDINFLVLKHNQLTNKFEELNLAKKKENG